MSDGTYRSDTGTGTGAGVGEPHDADTVDTAKHEAADLKDTAAGAAKDVAGTAKDEATSVAQETKAQAKDLFDQTRTELTDQASKQQERIAAGLGALGDELGSMAQNSDSSGIAGDLVQKVAERVSGAASWLNSRDPSGVLADVKSFARRRPAAFIGGSLLAGILVGRLTRALAANAKDAASSSDSATSGSPRPVTAGPSVPSTRVPVTAEESPLYAESAARSLAAGQGVSNERSDTF